MFKWNLIDRIPKFGKSNLRIEFEFTSNSKFGVNSNSLYGIRCMKFEFEFGQKIEFEIEFTVTILNPVSLRLRLAKFDQQAIMQDYAI